MSKKSKQFITPLNFSLEKPNFNVNNSKYIKDLKERSYGKSILPQFVSREIKEDFHFIYINENLFLKSEIALWRAVILQAGVDLNSKSKKKIAQSYRIKALIWFNLKNQEFKQVCEYAGFDPQYVIEKITPVKNKAVDWMDDNAREVL